MEGIFETFRDKKDSADDASVNSGYTTDSSNTSRPGLLSRNDDSTVSTSLTRNSKSVSFANPVAEDLIRPNAALTEEESIIGSKLSFAAGDMHPNDELHSILVSLEYKPANLEEFVQNKCNNLTLQQKGKILGVLNKHEKLFQGNCGEWTGNKVTVTLTKGAKPFRCSPYIIPLKQRNELEKEVYRQCGIGALRQPSVEEIEERDYMSPAFGVAKKDDMSMRLVFDLRKLNAILQRKEHYLSMIDELISGVGGFVEHQLST